MRGIIVFMTALFTLGIWYVVGVFMIEEFIELAHTVDLAPIGGVSRVETLKQVYFQWGPFVYLSGWFVWAVRYYVSPNRFRGQEVRR